MTPFSRSHLTIALAAVFLLLSIGSVVRLVRLARLPPKKAHSRRQSLLTWWILAVLMAVAVTVGPLGICLLLALASWLSLREYSALVIERRVNDSRVNGREVDARGVDACEADLLAVKLLFALIPLTYGAIYFGRGARTLMWLPMASLLLVASTRVLRGETEGHVRSTGALILGAVLLIFGPAHAALLLSLGSEASIPGARWGAGWFIYLILLTEMNDIAQALIGRRFGRHAITPRVSPNKTWEGFVGGVVTTCVIALVTAPLLTPLSSRLPESGGWSGALAPYVWPLLAGLLVAIAGFLGDLNMSAIKRDTGVKDSSDLLPGMGGALDRIDSLTLAAPCFYWLIVGSRA